MIKHRKIGLVLSALVAVAFSAGSPAFAAHTVNINIAASVGDQDVDTDEIEQAIAEYLTANHIEVSDSGDVSLDIGIAVDDDGEGFAVVMDWDSDNASEETEDLDIEAASLGEGIVGLLDAFVADMADGDIDGEDENEEAEGDD